ncbi:LacI family DNA-binding transcriptional regulator [Pseudogracilibacillus auburnensis]|uniref:LacI family transcriptional regulator n=1 Tax=Pseudogracilibacillus auburnensis TaxID=1494959 RepID=A0A2V3VSB1_9BACI|nr:LacI family DNA-binding transcriptional regulator [Pseudogracilibacillus auburnensis]MBO1003856.1 LacI family DNA-binding transcriptional regulator [Pseudogracilibacillus auburnensis]PXW84777.1 LacI family transcriptional regulator [Pseudogracilibacillus auburnensis]
MVTIKDVAQVCGVSPSTVSRVIADNPRISNATKKKVRKVMKELGYHPNISARNLVAKSTNALGVIMPSSTSKALQNPFFPEVLRGIGSAIHHMKYSMSLSTGDTEDEIFEEVKRMVYGSYVDGVILLYSRANDPVTTFLRERDFPFVIIGKPYEYENEITYVDNDNIRAGKEITEHLIHNGHERIAFIGGSTDLFVTVDREKGYSLALKEAGITSNEQYKVHTEFVRSGGEEAVASLFSLNNPPTGIVVSDDLISLGVTNMLRQSSYEVPKDISLVSFNNVYLAELTQPPLTTVDIQIYELGIQSARALIEKTMNKNEPTKRIIIPHKIVYRESVGKIK